MPGMLPLGLLTNTYNKQVRPRTSAKNAEKVRGIACNEKMGPANGLYSNDRDFQNKIVLTFDDGICVPITTKILDILKARDIKAVFFINGYTLLDKNGAVDPAAQAVLQRIVTEGHELGNHSYKHDFFFNRKYRQAQDIVCDLEKNQIVVDQALGRHYEMRYIRPPGGVRGIDEFTPGNFDKAVEQLKSYLILWQVTSEDYCLYLQPEKCGCPVLPVTPEKVKENVLAGVLHRKGGVVLFHDRSKTVKLLPDILDSLKKLENKNGRFEFTTLEELLRIKGRWQTP
jgi:peptidoglycan/xylan/chitin deacetylase (PgdA/CDA1 family)